MTKLLSCGFTRVHIWATQPKLKSEASKRMEQITKHKSSLIASCSNNQTWRRSSAPRSQRSSARRRTAIHTPRRAITQHPKQKMLAKDGYRSIPGEASIPADEAVLDRLRHPRRQQHAQVRHVRPACGVGGSRGA
jgi:hypothetical protein